MKPDTCRIVIEITEDVDGEFAVKTTVEGENLSKKVAELGEVLFLATRPALNTALDKWLKHEGGLKRISGPLRLVRKKQA